MAWPPRSTSVRIGLADRLGDAGPLGGQFSKLDGGDGGGLKDFEGWFVKLSVFFS